MVGLLNVVLPAAERWFVATYNEALPLVKDPRLAEDMRGFIGQEATHAETHEKILNDFMIARGLDLAPILRQVDHIFSHVLAPSSSRDPRRRFNHLVHFERLAAAAVIDGTTFTATAASTGATMTVRSEETLLSARCSAAVWPHRTHVSRASAAPAAPGYSTALCSIGIHFSPTTSATPAGC